MEDGELRCKLNNSQIGDALVVLLSCSKFCMFSLYLPGRRRQELQTVREYEWFLTIRFLILKVLKVLTRSLTKRVVGTPHTHRQN